MKTDGKFRVMISQLVLSGIPDVNDYSEIRRGRKNFCAWQNPLRLAF
ncbi:MAG TPA: hypothetical protein VK769_04585 [Verrucomicrobiae bacterium]|nr:hypothetical protein [Verrucomicrobiae bacterium]